ncbi:hypothetical protein [Kitasatospora indigofera]|uniref:hypothetical protein n=1 Tax=Kitasatospora indigofera TaxID=67307 RepID=UPI00167DD7B6|nr:hypothetical protein [Kitasatospora indigofera]
MSVALYVVTNDPTLAEALAEHCRRYAEAREWDVAVCAEDQLPEQPLDQRTGWNSVTAALSGGSASGIVTWTRSMVAATGDSWDQLAALVADRGAFLAAAALDTPDGRTHLAQ